MKKIIFSFVFLWSVMGVISQTTETVIYSNDFEATSTSLEAVENGFDFGDIWVRCFGSEASWTPSIATGSEAISGQQSFCLDIENPGIEPYELQFILNRDQMPLVGNADHRISFKIKSETPNNLFELRAEGRYPLQGFFEIQDANVVQEISFVMNARDQTAAETTGFKLWFGKVSNVGKVWIDDISVTVLPSPLMSTLDEDFNNVELNGNILGDFDFTTWTPWYYSLDADAQDVNNKFLHIQTITPANWYEYQFRTLKYCIESGVKYTISFKAKSDVPNTIKFKFEAALDFEKIITLSGGDDFETFSFESPLTLNNGMVGILWAFGSPTVVGSNIYLDDIKITKKEVEIPELSELQEDFNNVQFDGSILGNFELPQWSAWDYSLETDPQDVNNKFLRVQPMEAHEWFEYQFRTLIYRVTKDTKYVIQFKAKSDVPNTIKLKLENSASFDKDITLSGEDAFETFTFETDYATKDGMVGFLFAFGSPAVVGSNIYLDDIKVVKYTGIPAVTKQFIPIQFRNNRVEFPADLQALAQIYDLRGILINQGKVGNGSNSLYVSNDYCAVIVKTTDTDGNIVTSKVALSR